VDSKIISPTNELPFFMHYLYVGQHLHLKPTD